MGRDSRPKERAVGGMPSFFGSFRQDADRMDTGGPIGLWAGRPPAGVWPAG
jgi:hypothetical protein